MASNWLLDAIAPDTIDNPSDERLKELADSGGLDAQSNMRDEAINPNAPIGWLGAIAHVIKAIGGRTLQSEAQGKRSANLASIGQLIGSATDKLNMPSVTRAAQNSGFSNLSMLTPQQQQTAQIESGGNPMAGANTAHRGINQFSREQEAMYGINDQNWMDPNVQAHGIKLKQADDTNEFKRLMGREPTPTEMYAIHQRGMGGAINEIKNSNTPEYLNMLHTGEGRQKGQSWAIQTVVQNVVGTPLANQPPETVTSAQMMHLNAQRQLNAQKQLDARGASNVAPPQAPAGFQSQQPQIDQPSQGMVPPDGNIPGTTAQTPGGVTVRTQAPMQFDPEKLDQLMSNAGVPVDMKLKIAAALQDQTKPTSIETGLGQIQSAPGSPDASIIPYQKSTTGPGDVPIVQSVDTSGNPTMSVPSMAGGGQNPQEQATQLSNAITPFAQAGGSIAGQQQAAQDNAAKSGTMGVSQDIATINKAIERKNSVVPALSNLGALKELQNTAEFARLPQSEMGTKAKDLMLETQSILGLFGIQPPDITTSTIASGEAFTAVAQQLTSQLNSDLATQLGGAYDPTKFSQLGLGTTKEGLKTLTDYISQQAHLAIKVGDEANQIRLMPEGPAKQAAIASWSNTEQRIRQQDAVKLKFNGKPIDDLVKADSKKPGDKRKFKIETVE